MAHVSDPTLSNWTALDLVERFGAIPLNRIRTDPPPGLATEQDVIDIHDREDRLFELVDGVLVEKTVGIHESYLAMLIGRLLGNFVAEHNLGIVTGADGMMRLAPGLVRIPDVSYISRARLAGRNLVGQSMFRDGPDLAIEVISKWNTTAEMDRKLAEYQERGVQLIWYIYPATREVHVYSPGSACRGLSENDTLDGGDVLPGFALSLAEFFTPPA